TMKPFVPPPPPGVQPAPLWGREDHVRELFGDRVTDLTTQRQGLRVDHFRTPEAFRDFFKATYGPTIVAYHGPDDDAERAGELRRGGRPQRALPVDRAVGRGGAGRGRRGGDDGGPPAAELPATRPQPRRAVPRGAGRVLRPGRRRAHPADGRALLGLPPGTA